MCVWGERKKCLFRIPKSKCLRHYVPSPPPHTLPPHPFLIPISKSKSQSLLPKGLLSNRSAGNSLGTPPAHLRATAPPPPDAPSVAWGVRSPRGSRATRGGAPPSRAGERSETVYFMPKCTPNKAHPVRNHLYHESEEVCTPSPGNGTGAAGGLGPPPKECDPGCQGCRTPRSGDGPPSDGQGGDQASCPRSSPPSKESTSLLVLATRYESTLGFETF